MADDLDELEGEYIALDDVDVAEVVDLPDGGAMVALDEEEGPRALGEFYENLAEVLSEEELNKLAVHYQEIIPRDKEAREGRDKQYQEGLKRTGLGNDAPGGAQFEGASKVVHPMLTKGCVDFAARAIKELFPPDGPVKTKIFGVPTKARAKKGQRKSALMNWQLTVQAKEFRGELEQLLTQLPLGGGQYLKVTWDRARNRPKFLFIPIDDIYLPFAATNFYTADRRTEVQYITQIQYEARVKAGEYRDIDLMPPGMEPDPSKAEKANNKIEGRESTSYNEDGLRTVWEITGIMDIEEGVGAAPYILTIDVVTNKVLGLYRNWAEDDDTKEELTWIVEWPFIPWRGAYPIGLPHMIGGLSAAATGALRALLDAAHIANSQSMVKLKSQGSTGQTASIQPTEMVELEGGLGVDDIRKVAMPLPFNPPSNVLLQLLTFLVTEADSVVQTTLSDMANSSENMPVGTQLARIEQAMVVFSAIHQRLHAAFGRLLSILGRLNALYLDDAALAKEVGDDLASKSDFEGPLDVVPVSDPNIFSEAQRFAQVQAVAQRATLFPQLYDLRKVEERILETLKIPDAQSLLAPAQTPTEENAVKENVKASLGQPVIAMPDQDHVAHLKAHLGFLLSPTLGLNPMIAPAAGLTLLNHLKEHMVLWYAAQTFAQAEQAAIDDGKPPGYLSELMDDTREKEDKQALDRMVAEASLNVVEQSEEAFAQLLEIIPKLQQHFAQYAPKPPMDPAVEVAMQDVAMRKELGLAKIGFDKEKLGVTAQTEAQRAQVSQQTAATNAAVQAAAKEADREADLRGAAADRQADMARVAVEVQAREEQTAMEIAARRAMNREDNATAMELARVNARAKASQDPSPGGD